MLRKNYPNVFFCFGQFTLRQPLSDRPHFAAVTGCADTALIIALWGIDQSHKSK